MESGEEGGRRDVREMKRLTTDTPGSNFETMLNYVYGKDGWAHIRSDGEEKDVLLSKWAAEQCISRDGCEDIFQDGVLPEEVDTTICDCMMDFPDCPIALAYCFASQAVHMRDRLKQYEDILFSEDGTELVSLDKLREAVKEMLDNQPLTLEELRGMAWDPAWVNGDRETEIGHSGWAIIWYSEVEKYVCVWWPGNEYADIPSLNSYGDTWRAYRRKPEEGRSDY